MHQILNMDALHSDDSSCDSSCSSDKGPDSSGHYTENFNEKELLGGGGQGKVVKARSKLLNKDFAVKKVPVIRGKHKKTLDEVKALSRLEHRNIVRYYHTWLEHPYDEKSFETQYGGSCPSDLCCTTDSEDLMVRAIGRLDTNNLEVQKQPLVFSILYISMELCSLTLKDWILTKSDAFSNSFENAALAVYTIFVQMLEGLRFMHRQNIIHRDIKPANIFLLENQGNGYQVKIGDFGLSKQIPDKWDNGKQNVDDRVLSSVGDSQGSSNSDDSIQFAEGEDTIYNHHEIFSRVGTKPYAAPEVLRGSCYGPQVDMYSLGVILLEMSHADDLHVQRDIPREIDNIQRGSMSPKLKNDWAVKYLPRLLSQESLNRPSAEEILDELTTRR